MPRALLVELVERRLSSLRLTSRITDRELREPLLVRVRTRLPQVPTLVGRFLAAVTLEPPRPLGFRQTVPTPKRQTKAGCYV